MSGTYHDNGEKIGDIWGTLSGKRYRTWSGKFRDTGKSSKGKFTVRLQGDDVSFAGTFKTCGTFGASPCSPSSVDLGAVWTSKSTVGVPGDDYPVSELR